MGILFLLGPAGSFSDLAAGRFAKSFRKRYCASFREVFRKTAQGGRGFLPVKNKIFGELRLVAARFKSQPQKYEMISHIRFPVRLALMAKYKINSQAIEFICLNTFIRKQCGKFLKKHLGRAKKITSAQSSSTLIKKVVQFKGNKAKVSAVIGSEKAAKLFGLKILKRNIQDDPKDWTEFVLFKSQDPSKQFLRGRASGRARRKKEKQNTGAKEARKNSLYSRRQAPKCERGE